MVLIRPQKVNKNTKRPNTKKPRKELPLIKKKRERILWLDFLMKHFNKVQHKSVLKKQLIELELVKAHLNREQDLCLQFLIK